MFSRGVHMLLSEDINAPLPGTFIPGQKDSGVRPYGNIGQIDQYESAGLLNQHQLFTNVNTRFGSNFSMFGSYVFNHAMSNTDGAGSFPQNPYDLAADYGRAAYDIRHRVFMAGSANFRWNLRLSPFLLWQSGMPFNLTTGEDLFGDNLYNSRPSFAANPGAAGMVVTPCGVLDPNPQPGEKIVPRNCATGPSQFSLNVRLSKTFGFGAERSTGGMSGMGGGGGGGGRGGPPGGGPGGWGGMRGMFSDSTTSRRYNLTVGIMARNLFNNVNLGTPNGVITSPYFLQSTTLAGGYGASNAVNRRVELQARFTF